MALLDSFKRTEGVLSNGGKWSLLNGCSTKGECNESAGWETKAYPAEEGAYWNPTQFSSPTVIVQFKKVFDLKVWHLWACLSKPGEASKSGYRLSLTQTVTEEGKFDYKIEKCVEGTYTTLAEAAAVVMKANDRFRLSVAGGKVTAYRKIGEGAWEEIATASDATYTTGYIGFSASAKFGDLINFEGEGTEVSHTHTLTITQGQSTTKIASPSRTLKVTQTQAPSHTEVFGPLHTHILPIAQTQVVTRLLKQEQQRFLLTQLQSPKLAKALARTMTTTQPQSAALTKVDVHVTSGLLSMVI